MKTFAVRIAFVVLSALVASGCATLPSSGPTANQIEKQLTKTNRLGIHIVDINTTNASTDPSVDETRQPHLGVLKADGQVETVQPGDVLQVAIYEIGSPLFANTSRTATDGLEPSSSASVLAPITVGADGAIVLPYIGKLDVAGLKPVDIQKLIVRGMAGKSQSPQALVSIKENNSNTIYVSGDVRRPTRLALGPARERLLDAITDAGGPDLPPADALVRFSRSGRTVEEPLDVIRVNSPDNLVLLPGDRVELIRHPRTFTVFGATPKVAQIPFDASEVSLAEALARSGGPNETVADPAAVFVFRFERDRSDAAMEHPVIYRFNMLQADSYFAAQHFAIRDKDVLFIANARANQPTKLVNIINLLFAPLVLARQASGF